MNADDRRWIAETLGSDPAAFGHLVSKYQGRLYNAVLRVCGQADDALDVVQETFLSAYQSLHSFKGDAEFFTWLYRIAFNRAVSMKRRRKAVAPLELGGSDFDLSIEPTDESEGHRPDSSMERSEDKAKLVEALNRLSHEHREVLVLKDIDGLRYERIAEILNVPIGTIRSRIHRARHELRGLLEREGDDDRPIV